MSNICLARNCRRGTWLLVGSLCIVLSQLFALVLGAEPPAAEPPAAETPAAETPAAQIGEIKSVDDTTARIDFSIPVGEGPAPEATLFYGTREGGTVKSVWEHQVEVKPSELSPGKYSARLKDLTADTLYVCRVCSTATEETTETWSTTAQFHTLPTPTPWYILLGITVGVVALLVVPFMVGNFLARSVRMPDYGWKIGLVLFSLVCGVVIMITGWPPKLGIDLSGGVILVYEIDQKQKKDPNVTLDKTEMEKVIAAVSKRINPGGLKEVTVRQHGVEQIEIIIPEVDAVEARRIERQVSRTGSLEFRILANTRDHPKLIERARKEGNEVDRLFDTATPPEWEARWVPIYVGNKPGDRQRAEDNFPYEEIAKRTVRRGGHDVTQILVVNDPFDVTGYYLSRSMPDVDRRGQPCVNFMFNNKGGKLFGGLTSANLPEKVQNFTRKLGIILDGYLYSAPSIQSAIYERGEITGSFTREEVEDLVTVLNAGSLENALTEEPISRLQTGPTLGQDTIDKGKVAIGASMVLVLVFMLFYYRFAGVVACGALLMNLVLILAIMIMIKAAFTLPGLAGLVLTVGMAVDANVLIFERIREELARGAALRMAIRNGFSRATTTIVDANLTTLITGVVLYWIGTDQVKGFAVTLILGVTLSMYTAIFCSRVVFDIAERRRWITKLSMMRILGGTQIDFIGKRRLAAAVSLIVIVIGLVAVGVRRQGLLDIDFTGGVSVEVLFDKPRENITDVRDVLADILPDLVVSDVQIEGEPPLKRFMVNTSQDDIRDEQGNVTMPAIDLVEKQIHDIFGSELAANSMSIDKLGPAAADAEKASPEESDAAASTRNHSSNTSPLAVTGLAPLLLAQVDSADEESAAAGDEAAGDNAVSGEAKQEPPVETPTEPTGDAEEASGDTTDAPAEGNAPEATAAPKEAPAAVVDAFAGGTVAVVTFAQEISAGTLLDMLAEEFGSAESIPTVKLSSPNEFYEEGDGKSYKTWNVKIKLPPAEARRVFEKIQTRVDETPFFPSSNTIGGKVAGSTRTLAITALVTSLLFIVAYIWIRFQRVVFGLAAVVALVHDVLVTLGAIAISLYLAQIPGVQSIFLIDPFKIGLPALAAFLTIIGYSLNDTIVVFDRIREVRGKAPRLTQEMVNVSINQTLARTLLTSATTLLVVLILYAFGGQGIHGFAFALVVGVLVGTYSSIFVASPALLWMSQSSDSK